MVSQFDLIVLKKKKNLFGNSFYIANILNFVVTMSCVCEKSHRYTTALSGSLISLFTFCNMQIDEAGYKRVSSAHVIL